MSKSKKKNAPVKEAPIPDVELKIPPILKQVFQEPIAIGLALMVFLRPWRDGVTYPSVNYYFVAFTAILSIFLAVRMFIRKEALKAVIPSALLFSFIVVAFITGTQSVQPDVTHQGLIQYLGYLGLLFLCTNGIYTRLGIGIVLAAVTVTGLLNSVYAILHAEFTLPVIRQSIHDNPGLASSYFGPDFTAELKNRLEMDRAFGTLLFPNALAAYLIVSIPYYFGQWWGAFQGVKESWKRKADLDSIWDTGFFALLIPAFTALAIALYFFVISGLFGTNPQNAGHIIEGGMAMFFFYALLPGITLIGGVGLILKKGLQSYGNVWRITLISMAGIFQCYALWLSISRGGMIGLFVGMSWTALLLLATTPRFKERISNLYPAAGIATVLLLLFPISSPITAETPTDFGYEMPVINHDYRPHNVELSASDINVDGKEVTMKDMTDAGSLKYRITYWQVALRMIKDNFFTGVGLNNFGTIYGKYQFLDAGDVKTTHNDYLQVFSETGVFGFLLFSAFWIYIGLAGAARILRETETSTRLILGGLYAGIIAFLAHAFFDFNFTNPALIFMLFTITGLFLAYARLSQDNESTDDATSLNLTRKKITAALVILLSIYAVGMSWRQFGIDYAMSNPQATTLQRFTYLGNQRHVQIKMEIANYMTKALPAWKPTPEQVRRGQKYQQRKVSSVQDFITDIETIKTFGAIRVITDPKTGKTRDMQAGEEITDATFIFFVNIAATRNAAIVQMKREIELLEEMDKIWPISTKTAEQLYKWNKIILECTPAKEVRQRRRHADETLKWAKAMVERSPERPWNYFNLGQALWLKGNTDRSNPRAQMKAYREGLAVYKKGYELYPVNHQICHAYGEALLKMAGAFTRAGEGGNGAEYNALIEEGAEYGAKANEVLERGAIMARYKLEVLGLR